MTKRNLLSRHDEYLQIQGLDIRTRQNYKSSLGAFFQFTGLEPDQIGQVTKVQLRAFVANLQERALAPKTLAGHVAILKNFFRYAVAEGYLEKNPAEGLPSPKIRSRLPRALSPEQVRTLFATIAEGKSETDQRNLVFFHLCYVCGLRISESAGLRREHVDLDGGTLRVIGKGDKERLIYLKPRTVRLLADYFMKNGAVDHLFPGAQNGHIHITGLEKAFRAYAKKAGLPDHVTPHALRHSVAVHYLLGGAPISFVQQLLGHATLQTTGIYTRLTDGMTKDIARRISTGMDSLEKEPTPAKKTLKEVREAYRAEPEWERFILVVLDDHSESRRSRRI